MFDNLIFVLMLNDGVIGVYSSSRKAEDEKNKHKESHKFDRAVSYRIYIKELDAEARL